MCGVWSRASPVEARSCSWQSVALVGAGNSTGQMAVDLARNAAKVRMMMRGDGLETTTPRYLIDRIETALLAN